MVVASVSCGRLRSGAAHTLELETAVVDDLDIDFTTGQ